LGWPSVNVLESGRRPARALLFFACPKKRRQKKCTPTTCPRCATGSLRSSAETGAAELSRGIPAPHPAGAASGDNRAPARWIAISDRSDSPRFSRFRPAVLGCAEGGRGTSLLMLRQHRVPLRFVQCANRDFRLPSNAAARRAKRMSERSDESTAGESRPCRDQPVGADAFGYFWRQAACCAEQP